MAAKRMRTTFLVGDRVTLSEDEWTVTDKPDANDRLEITRTCDGEVRRVARWSVVHGLDETRRGRRGT